MARWCLRKDEGIRYPFTVFRDSGMGWRCNDKDPAASANFPKIHHLLATDSRNLRIRRDHRRGRNRYRRVFNALGKSCLATRYPHRRHFSISAHLTPPFNKKNFRGFPPRESAKSRTYPILLPHSPVSSEQSCCPPCSPLARFLPRLNSRIWGKFGEEGQSGRVSLRKEIVRDPASLRLGPSASGRAELIVRDIAAVR